MMNAFAVNIFSVFNFDNNRYVALQKSFYRMHRNRRCYDNDEVTNYDNNYEHFFLDTHDLMT